MRPRVFGSIATGIGVLVFAALGVVASQPRPDGSTAVIVPLDVRRAATQAVTERPLLFEENRGQTDRRAAFLARANGFTAFLTKRGPVLSLVEPIKVAPRPNAPANGRVSPLPPRLRSAALFVNFVGARSSIPEGLERDRAIATYFGPGRIDAPTFGRVLQPEVYPGIDVLYRGDGGNLRYDWLVAPGADPSRIALALGRADALHVTRAGALVVTVDGFTLRQSPPVTYQRIDGERRPVAARWSLRDGHAAFSLGRYDRSRPLIIDPTVARRGDDSRTGAGQQEPSVTTVGGAGFEVFFALAFFGEKALKEQAFGGVTNSPDFPGSSRPAQQLDATVAVFDKDGLRNSISLGGSGNDSIEVVQPLGGNGVFFAGGTNSRDLPVRNAFDPTYGGGMCGSRSCFDGFAGVLDLSARQIPSLTYLGGNRDEVITNGFPLDGNSVGLTGYSGGGSGFPSSTPFNGGPFDATFARYGLTGDRLVLLNSTFIGGPGNDGAFDGDANGTTIVVVGGSSPSPGAVEAPAFWISNNGGASFVQQTFSGGTSSAYVAELEKIPTARDPWAVLSVVNGLLPGTNAGDCRPNVCQPLGIGTFGVQGAQVTRQTYTNFAPPNAAGLYTASGMAYYTPLGRLVLRPRAALTVSYRPSLDSNTFSGLLWSVRLDADGPKFEKQETVGSGTALVTGVDVARDGTALVTGGAVPGSFPGTAVKGPADAFVARYPKFLAPCNCTSIEATASGYGDISSPRRGTRASFRVAWTMGCSAGGGQCNGEIRVVGPGGDVKITQPKRNVSCKGTCPAARAVKAKGSFMVRATSRNTLDPEKRAGKRFVYRLQKWCIVDGKRIAKPAGTVVVVYNASGALDRRQSDLNGNGTPDSKDKKK